MNLASDVHLITVAMHICADGGLVWQPASFPMPQFPLATYLTVTTVCILFWR